MMLGEIRVRPDGGFEMNTPGNIVKPVTLRALNDGVVMVYEVAEEGSISVEALAIRMRVDMDQVGQIHRGGEVSQAMPMTRLRRSEET